MADELDKVTRLMKEEADRASAAGKAAAKAIADLGVENGAQYAAAAGAACIGIAIQRIDYIAKRFRLPPEDWIPESPVKGVDFERAKDAPGS